MFVRLSFPAVLALVSTACIVETTDDEMAGTSATTTSSGTDSSGDTDETDSDTETSGDVSGSSGELVPDCTMCNTETDPDPLCHSSFDATSGACECDAGFEWEDPNDVSDFTCVLSEAEGSCESEGSNSTVSENGDCVCIEGYEWCSTDPNDITCCEVR